MILIFFLPQTINDLDGNGGIRAGVSFYSAYKNNLLPDISKSEVDSGFVRYRKFFAVSDYNISLLRAYLSQPSSAMDNVLIHTATDTDTQVEADDYTRWKGSGILKTSVIAGELASLVVTSENEGEGFNPLDLVIISSGNNKELIRIKSVSWNGFEATITPVNDTFLGSGYSSGAYVSACIERGAVTTPAFWFKETIPRCIASHINNISRLKFFCRRVY
jgi:hypothetical protein